MEVLIQNMADAPFYVPVRNPNATDAAIDRTIVFQEHQVTKVDEEIYKKFIIASPFFRGRIEEGVLRVLNADMLDNAVKQSADYSDVAYARYVDLMKKIRSAGGLANKDISQYLNADGTPKLDLLHTNFGRNIDPAVAEQFRVRYNAEANEGMHEDTLKLPGGTKVETGARDVEVEDEGEVEAEAPVETETQKQLAKIRELNLDDLKKTAMAMGVDFNADVTLRNLRKAVIQAIKTKE